MLKKDASFSIFPRHFGLFPYVFLIYLIMPLVYILRSSGFKLWFGLFLLVVFLITYRQLYWVNESLNIWLVIQLAIIFIVTAFYSPHQVYLGFFSANFIGWFSSKQSFYKAYTLFVLILCSALIVGIWYGDIPLTLYQLINIPFLLIMFVAPFGIRSMNKKMELEKKLDEANEQIKNLVKKEERLRIARDLHDTLGHTLSFITLQSQLAQKFVDKDPERAKQAAKEIEITSRSALKQVRELVTNMRTTTIVEELSEMEKILTAARIAFHRQEVCEFAEIPLLKQNIISMCLREIATNIVKHSQAKNCTILFQLTNGSLIVRVRDDGIGFPDNVSYGNGIHGIIERLSLIEGELSIQSDKFTEYMMTIPLVKKKEKEEMVI